MIVKSGGLKKTASQRVRQPTELIKSGLLGGLPLPLCPSLGGFRFPGSPVDSIGLGRLFRSLPAADVFSDDSSADPEASSVVPASAFTLFPTHFV